jgi:hypothetical protein
MKAVRTLSRYPDVHDDDMNPRIAVVALMMLFCESAKLDFLHKSFVKHWGTKLEFTEEMRRYVLDWKELSAALLHWKYHLYRRWTPRSLELLEQFSIKSERLALEAVHLVHNDHPLRHQVYYFFPDYFFYNKVTSVLC